MSNHQGGMLRELVPGNRTVPLNVRFSVGFWAQKEQLVKPLSSPDWLAPRADAKQRPENVVFHVD